jgi:hypothetical protein
MRKGKNYVEVGRINDFCPAFIDPDFLKHGLTIGAVTVPAGVMVDFHMSAVRTLTDVTPKFSGFTV